MRQIGKSLGTKTLYIFDLDLYGPTRHSWHIIKDFLRSGDIVYFDEAFDRDERIVIENYLIGKVNLSPLAASIFGLAFKVQ